jgi:hypothetical protein
MIPVRGNLAEGLAYGRYRARTTPAEGPVRGDSTSVHLSASRLALGQIPSAHVQTGHYPCRILPLIISIHALDQINELYLRDGLLYHLRR